MNRRIDDDAALWISRLDGADPACVQDPAFADWLSAPANQAAYERFRGIWVDPLLMESLRAARAAESPSFVPRQSWEGLAGIAAAASIVFFAAFFSFRGPQPPDERYSTPIAQRHSYELADASRLDLNADSAATLRFSPDQRFVHLENGEAFFRVSRDPVRPFVVKANGLEVIVHGTAFNIDIADDMTFLDVYEGAVEVRAPGRSTVPLRLTAGQRIVLEAGGLAAPETFDTSLGVDWMSDWLEIDNTPLARVMPELARYLGVPIEIPEPALAAKRISGRFRLSRPEDALRSLAAIHDFQIQKSGDAVVLTLECEVSATPCPD